MISKDSFKNYVKNTKKAKRYDKNMANLWQRYDKTTEAFNIFLTEIL